MCLVYKSYFLKGTDCKKCERVGYSVNPPGRQKVVMTVLFSFLVQHHVSTLPECHLVLFSCCMNKVIDFQSNKFFTVFTLHVFFFTTICFYFQINVLLFNQKINILYAFPVHNISQKRKFCFHFLYCCYYCAAFIPTISENNNLISSLTILCLTYNFL